MASTIRPTTVAEAATALRDSSGSVLFRGAGTKQRWGGRVEAADTVLETGGLDRVLAHNAADMTAAVQGGLPLATLQGELAGHGQWLALDPPTEPAGATIGGLLATGDSGPRRLRYGALRDLVIGVTLVLADGTVARAGGHVIKNVAGYDLSKLSYGSLGQLGLIAEVVLRVHPRPGASATVVTTTHVADATATTLRLLAAPLEPTAVDWVGDPRVTGRLAVRFEGSADGVAAQTAAYSATLDDAALGGHKAEVMVGVSETAVWQELSATGLDHTVAVAGTLPGHLTDVADALARAADDAAIPARLASHAALGLHTAHFEGPPADQARAFESWRKAVLALGGTVVLRDRPAEVDDLVDPLGPPPDAVHLLRAVLSRLDPDRRLAPGRLGTWLG